MTDTDKPFGLTINRCDFLGRVTEDPTFFEVEGGEGAVFNVKTFVPESQPNGQITDVPYVVPIINMNPQKTANVIKKYVTAGKEVMVGAYFKTWTDEAGASQSGLIMTFVKLGHGPFKKKFGAPDLPER